MNNTSSSDAAKYATFDQKNQKDLQERYKLQLEVIKAVILRRRGQTLGQKKPTSL